jgi:hypothetical protein
MAKVEIVGPTKYSKEIVSKAVGKAVQARLADLDQSIMKLRDTIRGFETKYSMETEAFLARYGAGELAENLDYMEWRASKEILEDLAREKEMLLEIE